MCVKFRNGFVEFRDDASSLHSESLLYGLRKREPQSVISCLYEIGTILSKSLRGAQQLPNLHNL